eukprot:3625664-Prorocentrum_lima.AAC.1
MGGPSDCGGCGRACTQGDCVLAGQATPHSLEQTQALCRIRAHGSDFSTTTRTWRTSWESQVMFPPLPLVLCLPLTLWMSLWGIVRTMVT